MMLRIHRRVTKEYVDSVTDLEASFDGGKTWQDMDGVRDVEVLIGSQARLESKLTVVWPVLFVDTFIDEADDE